MGAERDYARREEAATGAEEVTQGAGQARSGAESKGNDSDQKISWSE